MSFRDNKVPAQPGPVPSQMASESLKPDELQLLAIENLITECVQRAEVECLTVLYKEYKTTKVYPDGTPVFSNSTLNRIQKVLIPNLQNCEKDKTKTYEQQLRAKIGVIEQEFNAFYTVSHKYPLNLMSLPSFEGLDPTTLPELLGNRPFLLRAEKPNQKNHYQYKFWGSNGLIDLPDDMRVPPAWTARWEGEVTFTNTSFDAKVEKGGKRPNFDTLRANYVFPPVDPVNNFLETVNDAKYNFYVRHLADMLHKIYQQIRAFPEFNFNPQFEEVVAKVFSPDKFVPDQAKSRDNLDMMVNGAVSLLTQSSALMPAKNKMEQVLRDSAKNPDFKPVVEPINAVWIEGAEAVKVPQVKVTTVQQAVMDYYGNDEFKNPPTITILANQSRVGGSPYPSASEAHEEAALLCSNGRFGMFPMYYDGPRYGSTEEGTFESGLDRLGGSYRTENCVLFGTPVVDNRIPIGYEGRRERNRLQLNEKFLGFHQVVVALPDFRNPNAYNYCNKNPNIYFAHAAKAVHAQCQHALLAKPKSDTLIAGGLGCGIFKNNAYIVALAHMAVFQSADYENLNIEFAILDEGLAEKFRFIFQNYEWLIKQYPVVQHIVSLCQGKPGNEMNEMFADYSLAQLTVELELVIFTVRNEIAPQKNAPSLSLTGETLLPAGPAPSALKVRHQYGPVPDEKVSSWDLRLDRILYRALATFIPPHAPVVDFLYNEYHSFIHQEIKLWTEHFNDTKKLLREALGKPEYQFSKEELEILQGVIANLAPNVTGSDTDNEEGYRILELAFENYPKMRHQIASLHMMGNLIGTKMDEEMVNYKGQYQKIELFHILRKEFVQWLNNHDNDFVTRILAQIGEPELLDHSGNIDIKSIQYIQDIQTLFAEYIENRKFVKNDKQAEALTKTLQLNLDNMLLTRQTNEACAENRDFKADRAETLHGLLLERKSVKGYWLSNTDITKYLSANLPDALIIVTPREGIDLTDIIKQNIEKFKAEKKLADNDIKNLHTFSIVLNSGNSHWTTARVVLDHQTQEIRIDYVNTSYRDANKHPFPPDLPSNLVSSLKKLTSGKESIPGLEGYTVQEKPGTEDQYMFNLAPPQDYGFECGYFCILQNLYWNNKALPGVLPEDFKKDYNKTLNIWTAQVQQDVLRHTEFTNAGVDARYIQMGGNKFKPINAEKTKYKLTEDGIKELYSPGLLSFMGWNKKTTGPELRTTRIEPPSKRAFGKKHRGKNVKKPKEAPDVNAKKRRGVEGVSGSSIFKDPIKPSEHRKPIAIPTVSIIEEPIVPPPIVPTVGIVPPPSTVPNREPIPPTTSAGRPAVEAPPPVEPPPVVPPRVEEQPTTNRTEASDTTSDVPVNTSTAPGTTERRPSKTTPEPLKPVSSIGGGKGLMLDELETQPTETTHPPVQTLPMDENLDTSANLNVPGNDQTQEGPVSELLIRDIFAFFDALPQNVGMPLFVFRQALLRKGIEAISRETILQRLAEVCTLSEIKKKMKQDTPAGLFCRAMQQSLTLIRQKQRAGEEINSLTELLTEQQKLDGINKVLKQNQKRFNSEGSEINRIKILANHCLIKEIRASKPSVNLSTVIAENSHEMRKAVSGTKDDIEHTVTLPGAPRANIEEVFSYNSGFKRKSKSTSDKILNKLRNRLVNMDPKTMLVRLNPAYHPHQEGVLNNELTAKLAGFNDVIRNSLNTAHRFLTSNQDQAKLEALIADVGLLYQANPSNVDLINDVINRIQGEFLREARRQGGLVKTFEKLDAENRPAYAHQLKILLIALYQSYPGFPNKLRQLEPLVLPPNCFARLNAEDQYVEMQNKLQNNVSRNELLLQLAAEVIFQPGANVDQAMEHYALIETTIKDKRFWSDFSGNKNPVNGAELVAYINSQSKHHLYKQDYLKKIDTNPYLRKLGKDQNQDQKIGAETIAQSYGSLKESYAQWMEKYTLDRMQKEDHHKQRWQLLAKETSYYLQTLDYLMKGQPQSSAEGPRPSEASKDCLTILRNIEGFYRAFLIANNMTDKDDKNDGLLNKFKKVTTPEQARLEISSLYQKAVKEMQKHQSPSLLTKALVLAVRSVNLKDEHNHKEELYNLISLRPKKSLFGLFSIPNKRSSKEERETKLQIMKHFDTFLPSSGPKGLDSPVLNMDTTGGVGLSSSSNGKKPA